MSLEFSTNKSKFSEKSPQFLVDQRIPINEISNNFESLLDNNTSVAVAGRILGLRKLGKIAFANLHDSSGDVQIVLEEQNLSNLKGILKQIGLGDVVLVEGNAFVTKKEEKSILIKSLFIVAKCEALLPDKYRGIKDAGIKRGERLAELITNPESLEFTKNSSCFITSLRSQLIDQGYLEFETPVLRRKFAAGAAKPFVATHNAWGTEAFLRLTSEIELKQLIISGLDRVFEVGKSFRNEGIDSEHNPEFTLLEAYQTFANYRDIMILTRKLIIQACYESFAKTSFTYKDNQVNFDQNWKEIDTVEALDCFCGLKLPDIEDVKQIHEVAKRNGISTDGLSFGQAISKLIRTTVQPSLINPTFLVNLPIEISPLTKKLSNDPMLTERAWVYAGGVDFADIYSDLTDPKELLDRLAIQDKEIGSINSVHVENDLVQALRFGMPPCAGIGLSINRLLMILGNKSNIIDTLTFPNI